MTAETDKLLFSSTGALADAQRSVPLHARQFARQTGQSYYFGCDALSAAARLRQLADDLVADPPRALLQGADVLTRATNDDYLFTTLTLTLVEKGAVEL